MKTERIEIIDSHTAGEPTRVVVSGGPNLGGGSLAQRRSRLTGEFDRYRAAIVCEPRGSDVIVGAWLVAPTDGSCATGVIFFNNVGGIGMCGHGTIGVVATLAHLGRIRPGQHRIETPVGVVSAHLADDGSVTVENVVSHRAATGVRVEVPDIGTVTGDVAWGGNWFFLTGDVDLVLDLAHVGSLTERAWRIRNALNALGHPDVDHVELFGAAVDPRADARSFVLCPGKAYDRSPCGTGTSAKLACLAADGSLAEGASWMQESVIGSTFTASYRWQDRGRGTIVPSITGRAFVTVEASLVLDAHDPYRFGIQPV